LQATTLTNGFAPSFAQRGGKAKSDHDRILIAWVAIFDGALRAAPARRAAPKANGDRCDPRVRCAASACPAALFENVECEPSGLAWVAPSRFAKAKPRTNGGSV
jgi:hypothetical protein